MSITLRNLVTALAAIVALDARAAAVIDVPPWEFHNSFWMSLHQSLLDDVMSPKPRSIGGASPEAQSVWNEAVAAYRRAAPGHGDITFNRTMQQMNWSIAEIDDEAAAPPVDAPLAKVLEQAAPVYRAHLWNEDRLANRFFITYASAMVQDAGAELIRRHERVYRTSWPKKVLVFVTPAAGPFGAYTLNDARGVITTMSCRDEGYQGFRALEMLMHESSHAVVDVNEGSVASAIAGAAKRHGVAVPPNLWHALLFATSSELTRRLLVDRGIKTFVPSSVDLFTRAWPQYRNAVETFWFSYLDGKGTLEESIDHIVAAVGQPPR